MTANPYNDRGELEKGVPIFRNTAAGRMLRMLWRVEEMPEAEFMKIYSEIGREKGTRKSEHNSTFGNNFGRYAVRLSGRIARHPTNFQRPVSQIAGAGPRGGNMLRWDGPTIEDWVTALTDKELDSAFQSMESIAIHQEQPARAEQDRFWLGVLENEVYRRSGGDTRRRNPDGGPMRSAIKMYVGFHQHDPKKLGEFTTAIEIPETVICAGRATNVLYASDKLNPSTGEDEGWIDYIHDHGSGVNVYRCDRGAVGEPTKVPAWLRKIDQVVWLGDCLGFEYKSDELGTVKVDGTDPLPELFTIPSGKALLVIQGKRTLLAMIWGGKLGVEPRGIVH